MASTMLKRSPERPRIMSRLRVVDDIHAMLLASESKVKGSVIPLSAKDIFLQ